MLRADTTSVAPKPATLINKVMANIFQKFFKGLNRINVLHLFGDGRGWSEDNFWRELFGIEEGNNLFTQGRSDVTEGIGESVYDITGGRASADHQLENQTALNAQQLSNQKALMDYQYDLNSASNQLEQRRDAGLNPYQVEGAGLASGGSASSGNASAGAPSGLGLFELILGLMKQKNENKLVDSQVQKNTAEAGYFGELEREASGRADVEAWKASPEYKKAQMDLMEEQTNYYMSGSHKNWQEANVLESERVLKDTRIRISNLEEKILKTEEGYTKKRLEAELATEKAKEKYYSESASNQKAAAEELRVWINANKHTLDDRVQAELDKIEAQSKSIENEAERRNFLFWGSVASLVGAGVCLFIPGAQGVSGGLAKVGLAGLGISFTSGITETTTTKKGNTTITKTKNSL